MNTYYYETMLGRIAISENGVGITNLDIDNNKELYTQSACETPLLKEAAKQLMEYMNGLRTSFDLPLDPQGTTFQKQVWNALLDIPYGETRSYAHIAAAVGNPMASRAVGMANHKNPIMIIIPCHRVIGSNGDLVGYGGGLDLKRRLLELESKTTFRIAGNQHAKHVYL